MSIPPAARLPVGVEPLWIDTERVRFATLQSGPPTGRPLLLLPGFTGSKEDFLPLLLPLGRAGFRVVAVDQRGQHQTPGDGRQLDLADFTADALAVIGSLTATDTDDGPTRVDVVGHSFGGLVAREVVLAQPEAVGSLTLMDSGPGAIPEWHHGPLQALQALAPVATAEQVWEAKLELDRRAGAPPLPDDVMEFLRRRWIASDVASMASIAGILMTAADRVDELAQVCAQYDLPVGVMFGADDETAWPVSWQEQMAVRLQAPMTVIPGAAHSPAVENPVATTAALLDFLSGPGV